ncbi:MAG: hypothetical protein IKG93_09210 [Clostridiales bacterium]|nr:hypothetical protein [Clostridiales bacterium]
MRFRDLFVKKERVHKRPYITAITVVVVFFLIASFLFISLGVFKMESDHPKVSVTQERSNMASSGLGVNLSYVPSTNMVWDSSFENNYIEHVFNVAEAEGNAVFLQRASAETEKNMETFYKSGKLQIMAYDEEGRLDQVLEANVTDYSKNQLGIWKALESEISRSSDVRKICSNDDYSVAILENGNMIANLHTSDPSSVSAPDKEDPFVDSLRTNQRDYAVTKKGAFFSSTGGRVWTELQHTFPADQIPTIHALTSIDHMAIACGENGVVIVCDGKNVYTPDVGATYNLYTAVNDGERALLAGEQGKVLVTSNGSAFRLLGEDELKTNDSDSWILSSYIDGKVILLGSRGQLVSGVYNERTDKWSFTRFEDGVNQNYSPKQLVCFKNGDIWMLTSGGYIYTFSFSEKMWQRVDAEQNSEISAMGITSEEKNLFVRKGTLYTASMYTKVTIDRDIGEVSVQNGDVCHITVAVPSINSEGMSAWQVFGKDTSAQNAQAAPKTLGDRSLHLFSNNGDSEEAHFVSQVISRDEVSPMKDKVFYHMRLWIKQSNISGGRVMAWLSGLSEPIGTTFAEVSGNWREYSYTFAWPSGYVPSEDSEIRLNIGFYGAGELYCDGVRLERDEYSDSQIEPKLSKMMKNCQPEYIRLENLGIGRLGARTESNLFTLGNERLAISDEKPVQSTGVVSLESMLQMVKQSDANPWFVIDSSFSKSDAEVLFSYLCGNISEKYGKIRVDNGTAVPWMRQFDRVVIEVVDENGLFETDLERRAYVDYVLALWANSKYYVDYKDRVLLIDGMEYDSGRMNSQADYHSSTLHISNDGTVSDAKMDDMTSLLGVVYQDYQDKIPRIASSYIQEAKGEWISDLSISVIRRKVYENEVITVEQPLLTADIARCLLDDLGEHTAFVSVDLPISRLDGDADEEFLFSWDEDRIENRKTRSWSMENAIETVGVLHNIAKGYRVETNWTVPLSKQTDDSYKVELQSYAFYANGKTYLIIVNPTDQQQQFLIESDTRVRDIEVSRYSAKCEKIGLASTGNILRLNERRFTLQAGQMCIAVIPSEEKS